MRRLCALALALLWLLAPNGAAAGAATIQGDTAAASATAALFSAIATADSSAARQSLADGAMINAVDNVGLTPLMEAVQAGNAEIAQMLLGAQGIEIDRENAEGDTALFYAAIIGR